MQYFFSVWINKTMHEMPFQCLDKQDKAYNTFSVFEYTRQYFLNKQDNVGLNQSHKIGIST